MNDVVHENKLLLLGKLTAGLVHEIRNPLSAIKLNLDYMKLAQDDLPPDIKEIVNESQDAFDQVNFLIEEVLDFTRKPTDKVNEVVIDTVTDRCLKIISSNARIREIAIEKKCEDNLPLLNVNRNKLMQIFLNLMNNALEASQEKSKIIIRCAKHENADSSFIVWEVQDFGVGIKAEDKEKILGGYYSTKAKGSGIGLGVCRMLACELNAEITFESEYNKGTTFCVKFRIS
jgi:signal transduction histidine kinase